MKGERHVATSPIAAYSPAQPPLPTPSPISFSVASTRWSSTPPVRTLNLVLRILALLLSFGSALSLVAMPSTEIKLKEYPELQYLFTANILTVFYSTYQLFKLICDISHRGIFISNMVSDYISFILDQLAGYILVSASSVVVAMIQKMYSGNSLWKTALVSVCMSFTSFLVIAVTTLLSGYKLCKRIIW